MLVLLMEVIHEEYHHTVDIALDGLINAPSSMNICFDIQVTLRLIPRRFERLQS